MRYRKTENTMSLLGGALLGATAMYLLDPEMGRKRRSYIKDQAGEYIGSAGEALQGGWETARDRARGVAQTVAEKAKDYSQNLSDLAQDYSQRLSDQAKGAASSFAGQAGDVGRDYASRASGYADDITDYAHGLWKQVRGMGGKLRSRGQEAAEQARGMAGEEHTPVVPIALTAAGCCAIGIGLMYLMDPQRGRQRRAWLSDTLTGWARGTGQTFYRTGRDVANRTYGAMGAGPTSRPSGAMRSEQLRDQVQSEIWRVAPQAQAVQVMADLNGSVTLTGSVRPEDSDLIIAAVEDVDGVNLVINRLNVGSGQSTGGQGVPQM